jgi:hypothetical protein
MLWVCSSAKHYQEFKEKFRNMNNGNIVDLSKADLRNLADECDSVVQHHAKCSVFLGFLEPGWMITPQEQTRIRKLIRKCDVGMVSHFPESLPYSWKNEINTFYICRSLNQNGNPNSIDDGGALQNQSDL